MSVSSELVEKLGDNTVKIVRNGQIIRLPKQEYDSLQPINPSRFGRFSGRGGAEQRDEALELGLRLVLQQASPLQQSLLTENEIAALAQTNRIVLEQALSSNANNFRASRAAKAQFLNAIRRGDRETVALFERFDAPSYLRGPPGVDVLDPLFIQALNAYAQRNENDLFERLFHRFDHVSFAPDTWEWDVRRVDNIQVVFETIMRQRNMALLQFLIDEMPEEVEEQGMLEWVLLKASEFNWEEAVRYLASTVLVEEANYYSRYMENEDKTPLVYWIKRKNLRMIIEILRRRDPVEQRAMLRSRPEDDDEIAIVEALRMGPDALDIVKWILSNSKRGESVCGRDTLALITALHYTDPLGNVIEAPTEIVAQIIRDYATNYGAPAVADAAAGGGGAAAAAAAAAGGGGGAAIFSPQANVQDFSLRVYRQSPLLACCKFRETDTVECARLILDAGADPNEMHRDTDFTSPLIEACRRNNIPLARLLLQRGANPNTARNRYTSLRASKLLETPLLVATTKNSREMIELLLTAGADPLQKITVKVGAEQKSEEFLTALLYYGIDPIVDFATIRFLIQEKRFRTTDHNFLFELLENLKEEDAAGNVSIIEGGRDLFLTALEGSPPPYVVAILRRLMNLILSDSFEEYAQAYAEFVLSIDPNALTIEALFDAILDEDARKVAFILSKISREKLRQIAVYQKALFNFTGTALDFAIARRRDIDPSRSRDEIEVVLSIVRMIQDKM